MKKNIAPYENGKKKIRRSRIGVCIRIWRLTN